MQRISMSWFMQLGALIQRLRNYPYSDPIDAALAAHLIKPYLEHLVTPGGPLAMKTSWSQVQQVLGIVNSIINAGQQAQEQVKKEANNLSWGVSRLDTLLDSELAIQPTYHVWPKRAYDTDVLVMDGTRVVSEEVRAQLAPADKYDLEQAGKCLAFETSTAAAFHLFRATESVIRRYYAIVVGTLPKEKMRNWGAYIKGLQKHNADPKVINALQQIKDLYRNPVFHPGDTVNLQEALSLLGIAESAISAMFADAKIRADAKARADAEAKVASADVVSANDPGAAA